MNEKWFAPDISQIEKKLKTNAASGLSLRAARSRRGKAGGGFFITPKKSVFSIVLEVLSDFALVILLISAVVALCFREYTLGIGVLVTLLFNIVVTAALYYRSQRLFESVENYFHPSVTVIRGGKAYCIDSESVVVGDVVLLSAGDVLSFDARLITSDKLRVMVRVDRKTVVECEKYAECRVSDVEYDIRNMPNMVHAGSVIKEGSARAIVTAVGRYTYYGAMTGGVVLNTSHKVPRTLSLLKKYCSSVSFALMIAILPFTLLCLLLSHEKVTLLTAFTSVLAIAASSMSGISCTACKIFFERQARKCLSSESPTVMRSAEVMERLSEVDYIFLLDGGVSSDGVLHFERAVTIESEENASDDKSASSVTLGELASLYDSAENRTLTMGIHTPGRFSTALGEFVRKSGVDSEALKIRCTVTGYVPGNITDNTDKLFYLDGDIRYILSVSSQISSIEACNRTVRGSEIESISDNEKQRLVRICEAYINKGKQLLVFTLSDNVAAEADVKLIFAGILVLSQKSDRSFKNSIELLAARGVKTVSFVNVDTDMQKARTLLSAPMLSSGVSTADFERVGQPITYRFGKISTYINMMDSDIDALLAYAHSMKKKVAIVSFNDRYKALKEKADIFISASALQYRFVGRFEEEIEALEVAGAAESISCRQDIKADADIIVPRPSDNKGGLSSLIGGLAAVDAVHCALSGFFRYVLCTQFVRIVTVLLPMIFGAAHLDARHALFCGSVIDIFVLFIFCFASYSREKTVKSKMRIERELTFPLRNNVWKIAAASVGALCAVILPYIIGMLGFFGRYLYETEYLFISMVLIHLTIAYCTVSEVVNKHSKREKDSKLTNDIPSFVLLGFLIVFFVISFVVRPVGAVFGLIEISLPYLVLTLVPSVITLFLFLLIGRLRIDK